MTSPITPTSSEFPESKGWMRSGAGHAVRLLRRMLQLSRRSSKQLRLCENLPLGDRRFVAVIEFEGSRFLLGGTPSSLTLLAQLSNQNHELGISGISQPSTPCGGEVQC